MDIGSEKYTMIQIAVVLCATFFASSLGMEVNPKFKVKSGEDSKPAFYEQNTQGLYFGDIKLTPKQKEILLNVQVPETNIKNSEETGNQKRKFYKAQKKWPGGKVYYEPLSMGSFRSAASYQNAIRAAMQHIEAKTCIRFFASASASNRIRFVSRTGCNSPLGMVGGVQEISLGQNCDHTGVVIHEILHSLGFMHEQNRPDRDNYVTINWSNIPQQWVHAFTKHPWSRADTFGIPYDFSSIMQYEPKAFASDRSQYTIIPKTNQAYNLKLMGNMKELAPNDIQAIQKAYQNCGDGNSKGGDGNTGTSCVNENSNCEAWARVGECEKSPGYMLSKCKKACGRCDGGGDGNTGTSCVNENSNCEAWARVGECEKSPGYMLSKCKKACGQCDGGSGTSSCTDKNQWCSSWASSGECDKNPAYMLPNCPRSCGRCQLQ